tara:strand:+ start:556 stop:702 length:147 start_codon:yes stop_codon:yes gene_type:complete
MKHIPPIGVIAPSQRESVITKKYKLPEKIIIPAIIKKATGEIKLCGVK